MRIGEAAKELGLTVSNIRFYEKKGLLTPFREQENQYRDYTPEDIRRLKQIILYRKLDLPIETIHNLLENETDFAQTLEEQEKKLCAQMEILQGSLTLCRKLAQEENPEKIDVDLYLKYVKEEEAVGGRFPQLEELLDDMVAFSRIGLFRGDLIIGGFFRNPWTARILVILLTGIVVIVPLAEIVVILYEKNDIPWKFMLLWIIIWLSALTAFIRYRRETKK
ncbi:MAG: MerR family transcriptional regulator [Eubacteriales bacterium]|nr:MerR family transcriptional regulator [Eubacteriales bacterium]